MKSRKLYSNIHMRYEYSPNNLLLPITILISSRNIRMIVWIRMRVLIASQNTWCNQNVELPNNFLVLIAPTSNYISYNRSLVVFTIYRCLFFTPSPLSFRESVFILLYEKSEEGKNIDKHVTFEIKDKSQKNIRTYKVSRPQYLD